MTKGNSFSIFYISFPCKCHHIRNIFPIVIKPLKSIELNGFLLRTMFTSNPFWLLFVGLPLRENRLAESGKRSIRLFLVTCRTKPDNILSSSCWFLTSSEPLCSSLSSWSTASDWLRVSRLRRIYTPLPSVVEKQTPIEINRFQRRDRPKCALGRALNYRHRQ